MFLSKNRFKDKVVLITGASSGIGAALAREMASEGAVLSLCARRRQRLEQVAADCRSVGADCLIAECDVTRDGDLERAVAATVQKFGKLDVVVANAGFGVAGSFRSLSLEDYRRQFETNVFGLLRTAKAAFEELKKSRGQLVLVGSVTSYLALPGASAYAMSKFAVRAFADAVTRELARDGIAVTLLTPGFVESEIRKVDNTGTYHAEANDPVPPRLQVSARRAAREIAGAIAKRKREQIVTGHAKVIVWVHRHFPWVAEFLKRSGLKGRESPKS